MGSQQIHFTTPQTEAAFNFSTYAGASGIFQAFLNGVEIETATALLGSGDYYGFTNIEFDAISISTNAWPAWIIDNVQLEATLSTDVPEPTITSLLVAGFLGLLVASRKKLLTVGQGLSRLQLCFASSTRKLV
jgi:hypothetical protein